LAVVLAAFLGTLGACVTPGVDPTPSPEPEPATVPIQPSAWTAERGTMTLTLVYDNHMYDRDLQTAWGFSAWLEYNGHTILFDTGGDGSVLLSNLTRLGLKPQDVDSVVLSHAHRDHTGGLAAVLATNSTVTVYLPAAFPARFKAQVRAAGARVVEVSGPLEILPGLWSTGPMGNGIIEQALIAETAQGSVVITGCAHPGVDKMAARAAEIVRQDIYLLVGGFHLGGASQERIGEIISRLQLLGVEKVAPCHCTGDTARSRFQSTYGQDYFAAGAGWQIAIDLPSAGGRKAAIWQSADSGIPSQLGIAAVAVASSDPAVVYMAVYEPGGLYRSTDGGDSWQAAKGGLPPVAPLSLAVDPANPMRAWTGTMLGGYRTSDGGRNWAPMDGLGSMAIYALALDPRGAHLYAGGEEPGLRRSDDGGQTWSNHELGTTPAPILSLAVSKEGTVWAGTARGLWKSRDAAATWQELDGAMTSAHVTAIRALDDGRVYALADGFLDLSADGGHTWQSISPPGFVALSFAIQSGTAGRLYLGSGGRGLDIGDSGGEAWTTATEDFLHADITCLVSDPANPNVVYAGTRYHGLYRTVDGGSTWRLVSGDVGTPVITALARNTVEPQTLYAGTLDGVYLSDDGGAQWRVSSRALGKLLVQTLEIDPATGRIYAGTQTGIYTSDDGGRTWHWAEADTSEVAIFCIQVDPHDRRRIYAGSWGHNVLRSTDGGQRWLPIHRGLETLSVYAFAIDPTDPQLLYAGTVEAVYRSTDCGQTWQASPLNDRPLTTFALAIDPGRPATVFAGTTDGLYRSQDRGQTWQAAGRDSLDATVTALWLDPAHRSTMYAGTEHQGLFRSADRGQQWEPWGLEGKSVYALLVDQTGTVWAGTDQGLFKNP
jgi:7,8-dihydropterin-6-yl-methyl-4-(beta-D-ribofuranosyl)aminobenzene 5'-phosphate synthase